MKERYLNLMERVVCAYTTEHIDAYTETVTEKTVKEHGFPRLTANIGILLCHGRLPHLKSRFKTMMDLCCRDIPAPVETKGRRGNDFSVREILLCILEVEKAGLFPKETTDGWRAAMGKIDPYKCYRVIAPVPAQRVCNWAAFNASGEQLRKAMGLADESEYIENQVASQMLNFDENGMFRDPFDDPMVYDLTPRIQLSNLLHFGYCGIYAEELDRLLQKGGLCNLKMQSVTGELAFGGRSNQFLHNEACLAVLGEHEAMRYKKQGNMALAGQFRRLAELAVTNIEAWLDENGMFHVKNRYPLENTSANSYAAEKHPPAHGCENYAYYDKYMVTTSSLLYNALMFCDETIPTCPCPAEIGGYLFEPADHFRMVFVNCGGYFLQFDKDAESLYDATGLGRIHKKGAPGPICLSVPVSQEPHYGTDGPNPCGMAIAPLQNGILPQTMELTDQTVTPQRITTRWLCRFETGATCPMTVSVSEKGVDITAEAEDILLPAFDFDGAAHTELTQEDTSLCIGYKGWLCRYTAAGIRDTGLACSNRNGKYRLFAAQGPVHIAIEQA